MKYLGPVLAGGLTLVIVLVVGIFSVLPKTQPDQAGATSSPAVNGALPTVISVSQETQTEAAYQAQIQQLNHALQQRQATYQAQIPDLTNQITAAQGQLDQLKAQEQSWPPQITQLETARSERLKAYQAQLDQAKNQYTAQLARLQTQLTEAQTKLAQANAQLGR